MPKYKVIKDSSEHAGHGWTFSPSANCEGMDIKSLYTGDYTIEGYEDNIIIERKGALSEFAANINQLRFKDELERMNSFRHPFVILEFTLDEMLKFPEGTNIPKKIWPSLKVTPFLILKKICEFELTYKTRFIYAGHSGKEQAASLFKRILEIYGK